jgi:hypothetical protein
MSKDAFEAATIISRGGWDSNRNWLEINETNPGMAAELINFEPSLYGGYRRINGFTTLESTDSGFVDSAGAEGKILGVAFFKGDIIAMRKQQSGATYELYKLVSNSSLLKYTTGLTLNSSGVNRVRSGTFNFDGKETIVFADGVNNAYMFNGTNWARINPAASGANFANAGGPQALAAPTIVTEFEGHLFMAGENGNSHIVAHSSPNSEYNWTSAGGAGQINSGMPGINMIKVFRENLFVFSKEKIKKIYVDSTTFVIDNVTEKVGCLAGCSVVEINGDLVFLSEDGFRPISATERIGDVEIATISKSIQGDLKGLIKTYAGTDIIAVEVPSKSQFRCFFTPSSVEDDQAKAILGALVDAGSPNVRWEWTTIRGIKISCAAHGHSGAIGEEYVVHGTHDGKVMIQESGNSFNGVNIQAKYTTPYIDFQQPAIRKTLHEIMLFTRPEGDLRVNMALKFDWGISDRINPTPGYNFSGEATGDVYGIAIYGTDTYGGGDAAPVVYTNVQGSCKSFSLVFSSDDTNAPYTIQGFVVKYKTHGYA